MTTVSAWDWAVLPYLGALLIGIAIGIVLTVVTLSVLVERLKGANSALDL